MKMNSRRLAFGVSPFNPRARHRGAARFRGDKRLRVIAATVLALLALSSLGSCGTPRCTLKGCGFDSNF